MECQQDRCLGSHFGVAITNLTSSVHEGSIYYSMYGFLSERQTRQFIKGVEITQETEDNVPIGNSSSN